MGCEESSAVHSYPPRNPQISQGLKNSPRKTQDQPSKIQSVGTRNPQGQNNLKQQKQVKNTQEKAQIPPSEIKTKEVSKPMSKPVEVKKQASYVPGSPLPSILSMAFQKQGQKMLSGKQSTEKTSSSNTPTFHADDILQNIGVVSLWYQNSCYTDGRYNNSEYNVQKGVFGGKQAYKIHPPLKKFTQFLASQHCICLKLPTACDYKIYKFENNSLDVAFQLSSSNVKVNDWTIISDIKVSKIQKPMTLFALPAAERISPFTLITNTIEGATIFSDQKIRIQQIKFALPQDPPVPESFDHGPGGHYNCYNPNRDLSFSSIKKKQYLIWGSPKKDKAFITEFDRSQMTQKTVPITKKTPEYELAAACGDQKCIYYAEIESGDAPSKDGTRKMYLVKCSYKGEEIQREMVPTDKEKLNIFHFDACQIVFQEKEQAIGMIVSRKMTKHVDGLNHQGAYAAVFDANTLKLIKQFGQTSGHSFAHSLIANNRDGGFIGYDLGDNYPRGVHHWRFTKDTINMKLVHSFKTLHGETEKSPAGATYPHYPEISQNGKNFYKWSNDNKTYTELAAPGVMTHTSGNILVFAGQNEPNPLDNSKTGTYNNCSRNVGFVKISADLKEVLSKGESFTGGFFNFGGGWTELKSTGVEWVTKLPSDQNASRLKAIMVNDIVVIFFELWTSDSYINTQYMLLDQDGKILKANTVIPFKIRLHKSDDIHCTENSVLVYSGSKRKIMNRYEIFIK